MSVSGALIINMFKLFFPFIPIAIVVTLAITPVYEDGTHLVTEFARTGSGRVLAVFADGHLITSDDSGDSWVTNFEAGERTPLTSIITLQNGNIVTGGLSRLGRPCLFLSTDNGSSWGAVVPAGINTYSLRQIGTSVFLFGRDTSGPAIYRSLDNGLTWGRVLSVPGIGHFVSGHEIGSNIIAIRDEGQVYRSANGGLTWVLTASNLQARYVIKIIKATDGNLYAISLKLGGFWQGGNLFKSNDGVIWTVQYTSRDTWFNNIIEVGQGNFYALASVGTTPSQTLYLMKSTDYGVNWIQVSPIRENILDYDDTRFGLLLLPDNRLLIGTGRPGVGIIYRTDPVN